MHLRPVLLAVVLALLLSAAPAAAADPEPVQLVRVTLDSRQDLERLQALDLDVSHEVSKDAAEVITYTAAERERISAAGLAFAVEKTDLGAETARVLRGDLLAARAGRTSRALPSGRTTYRTPADYPKDLAALVDSHPGHVRPVSFGTSLENRPIEGIEIAAGTGRPDDGRPVFLLGGVTHAREWPSGEMAIEFATDLARTFAAGTDPRIDALLRRVRVVVVPVFNPDGYAVSRNAADALAAGDDRPSTATAGQAVTDSMAYKRKNCRPTVAGSAGLPCAQRQGSGVDLNRAYGAFWGGAGSSSDPTSQGFRGSAPFTEPETLGLREYGKRNQIQVFISNHTFTAEGRILRQPGFKIPNDEVPDVLPEEPIFVKLGDQMAAATAGISELGYATLGNITGPADDFLFYSQGTIGYTPELRGTNFHTSYARAVVGEYEGTNRGSEGQAAQGGWREAYLDAAEQAGDEADHVVLRGAAPPGRTLRLKRTSRLRTSSDTNGDGTQDVESVFSEEPMDTTIVVPASGRYEWHVNPSTQPLLAEKRAFAFTCEEGGTVLETHTPIVDRGQVLVQDFTCARGAAAAPDATPSTPTGPIATATPRPTATATASPTPTPTAAKRIRVGLRRPNASARRTRRRGFSAYVSVRDGALRSLKIRVTDRRGRTVADARRSSFTRSGKVRFKLRRRPSPGVHRVTLTARDATGAAVRVTRSFRFRR